jgi:hypothetical protein
MQDCVQFVEINKAKQLILEIVDRTRQQQTKEEKREREREQYLKGHQEDLRLGLG